MSAEGFQNQTAMVSCESGAQRWLFQQKEIAIRGQQIAARPGSWCREVAAGRDERERSSQHPQPSLLLGSFSKAASKTFRLCRDFASFYENQRRFCLSAERNPSKNVTPPLLCYTFPSLSAGDRQFAPDENTAEVRACASSFFFDAFGVGCWEQRRDVRPLSIAGSFARKWKRPGLSTLV